MDGFRVNLKLENFLQFNVKQLNHRVSLVDQEVMPTVHRMTLRV
jgi:hypothetical protein